jgi:branched-chain amino acid transport system permease protein
LLAAVVAFWLAFRGTYLISDGITIGATAIAAIGLIILLGFARQIVLGQAVFCMVGGYGNALLATRFGWDPFLAMILSALAAILLAYLVGKPILRLDGFFLAMASLALQLIFVNLAMQATAVTGGALGISGIPTFRLLGLNFNSDTSYFWFVWTLVLATAFVGINLDRSYLGRALRLIASSEAAAAAAGMDIAGLKLQMFVVSAGLASVTGSLFVHFLRIIEPSIFGFQFSIDLITAVIVGGLGSIWGGILGATLIVFVREGLRGAGLPLWDTIIMGALSVTTLLVFPRGLAGAAASLVRSRAPAQVATSPANGEPARFAAAGLTLEDVSKAFIRLQAVDGVSFAVEPNTITALIGPNGAGKTTLFNLISGLTAVDAGTISLGSQRIERLQPDAIARLGVARTFQIVQLAETMPVEANVMAGAHRFFAAGGLGRLGALVRSSGAQRRERHARAAAARWLAFVGLAGMGDRLPASLSFGHQRFVEIARALALEPAILLLDEPASGLNDNETEALAELIVRIRDLGMTVVIVEHDMRLIMGLADHVIVMSQGRKIADAAPQIVRADAGVIEAYLGGSV